jgi:hypothetical protein
MKPQSRTKIQILLIVVVVVVLFLIFPAAFGFVEMAARSLRHLWWLILLLALGIWLVWGIGRRPR